MKIAITGASGFIGNNLITALLSEYKNVEIIGLSRYQRKDGDITWRKCDFYSLLEAERALKDVDIAIYLIHSMMPSASLCQGSFEDYDLILADNFIRACQFNGVKKVLYLGGILPELPLDEMSPHLRSRYEVEQVISSTDISSIALRAGLIVGKYGSSFQILNKIVEKFRLIPKESRLYNHCEPIYIKDVTEIISILIFKDIKHHKIYDVSGDKKVSYLELIQLTAKHLNKKIYYIPCPHISEHIISRALSFFTRIPTELLHPLLQSLKHDMLANPNRSISLNKELTPLDEAIKNSVDHESKKITAKEMKLKNVRSVIRLNPDHIMSAQDVANEYYQWLPHFFWPFLRVHIENRIISFYFFLYKKPLLVLKHSLDRSLKDRQLFYIVGGVLASLKERGRLEFRKILDDKTLISAIHNFRPTLPWYIYIFTQAPIHWITMKAFSRHLKRLSANVDQNDL